METKATNMDKRTLQGILAVNYGIMSPSLEFLREGGSHTYIVNGKTKYLLKVIGSAFSDTARQSVSIMRYLEENGFPVSSAAKKFFLFHTGSRSGIFSYRPQSLRYTVWIA